MAEIRRDALFGKLNQIGYQGIESAHKLSKLRGNRYVELVHWLNQILQYQDSDLHRIVDHFGLEPSRLAKDLTTAMDSLPRGATEVQDLSPHVEEAVERGWVYGSLMFGDTSVRTGYLIVGILKTQDLRNALWNISREFQKVSIDTLTDSFREIVARSPEESLAAETRTETGTGTGVESPGPVPGTSQEALEQYSVDLTQRARDGEIDPIVGRDEEIRQIVDILMRRRQNNPILTGEAGVGKTAVVEGFALRIAAGDVPPPIKNVALRSLDIGLLQAGASMKGEFENRLRQVIEEVQSSETPIILFIDEAHTLIGAGGAAGTGDAANLLKPALARGTLRTIAATTWSEYKKHIEKDPALTRRFQVVQVLEPSEDRALRMMRKIASTLESHHRVQVLDEALESAVQLSSRYIPARHLPDKSVSLLDTASARVAIGQHAVPAEVDDCRRQIQALETELDIIDREAAIGIDVTDRRATATESLATERDRLKDLETRWNSERELVDQVLSLRARLREESDDSPESEARERDLQELKRLQDQLHELQGETPLILPSVDAAAVASVVADWTGIPVGRMVKDQIQTVLHLGDALNERVIGQRHALDMIANRVQTSRASLDNPQKPVGVFLLCGPSGVGKTETALALGEALYGGEQNVITINMSEFQESHTVSTLKGAPPGYVGYGEGGVLTEAVRRRPYSIVLLDEVEKAHADVHEIFFQVFDKGQMEDGEGRMIDFKNTIILLTSNVGTDLIMSMCRDPELMPDPEGINTALRKPLLEVFPAALLGRLVVLPFYPLSDEVMSKIIRLQLGRIENRVKENHGVPFTYDEDVVDLISRRCTELESGGRMIDSILTNTVLPAISHELLGRMMDGKPVERVHVGVKDEAFEYDIG